MLVGREAELRTIATALAAARVADSQVLVLTGEAGIGKSALLAEAQPLAGEMRVLHARGLETERHVPFSGLLQLLRPVLPLLDGVPAAQARALKAALLLDAGTAPEPSRFAVGAATLGLLCRAAEDRPVAVLLDDAHLLDQPSAEALVFAARRLLTDPIAVVACVRTGTTGAALWRDLPQLEVRGLDLDAARAVVAVVVPADGGDERLRERQVRRLHRATAGNPLALLELRGRLAELEARPEGSPVALSRTLGEAFLGRADALSAPARTALLVAAADSQGLATVRAACARLGRPDATLTEAVDAGLVSLTADGVEFRHPLVRSAVYAAATPAQRRAVHRALAHVVPADETDRLAWHLSEGAEAPDDATADLLDGVATQAASRGAHAIAAATAERAAQLSSTPGAVAARLASAGEWAWLAGNAEQALDLLRRAERSDDDPHVRARVRALTGAVQTRSGSLEDALAVLRGAAEAVAELDPAAAVGLYADAIHVSVYLLDPVGARACADAVEALQGRVGDRHALLLGSMASGMALVLAGSGADGIAKVRAAAYDLVAETGEAEAFRLPLRVQGALWLRDADPSRDVLAEAVERFREEAALGTLPYLLWHIARDAATTDRWDDAEAAYLEAIRLATETGQTTDLGISSAGLAVLHARRGRDQACADTVQSADELCRRHHLRLGSAWLLFAQGDLAAGRGRLEEAFGHYEHLQGFLAERDLADPDQSCAPELVETAVHLGRDPGRVRAVAEEFAELASAKGQPWSLARADRALGLCGEDDAFPRALARHALTPDRYETARTELAYGARLRRQRRRSDARPLLRSALATFDELGARPWADLAAGELQATGETARRRELSAAASLTPQERQIAQLLASGRSTREAAAALFLSPKTVEYHLRHVYQKLAISSRAELAEAFPS